jgi:hypothetical protein
VDISTHLSARLVAFGLTAEEAAQRARLGSSRLRALLDHQAPNLDELHRLGRALVFDPYAVVRGGPVDDPARSPARFKQPEGARGGLSPRDVFLLARAAELARTGGWLTQLLKKEVRLARHRGVSAIRPDVEPWEQGYSLAAVARDRLAPGREPVSSVQDLMEELGVHVAFVELSAHIAAAALFEPGAIPVVLLNRHSNRVRSPLSRRASLAHELCHLLHDGGERDLLTVTVRAAQDPDPFEQRANGFAPAFLAHPESIRAEHGDSFRVERTEAELKEAVVRLSLRWGFAPVGAVWHARNCGLLSAADAERLNLEPWPELKAPSFEAAPSRRELPDDVDTDDLVDGHYSDLVAQAFQSDEISKEKLQELLWL